MGRSLKNEGVVYFNGSLSEYVRVQETSPRDAWWVVIGTHGSTRMITVPYKRYALMIQAALIAFGVDRVNEYIEGVNDVSTQQAEASSEGHTDVDASEHYSR